MQNFRYFRPMNNYIMDNYMWGGVTGEKVYVIPAGHKLPIRSAVISEWMGWTRSQVFHYYDHEL